MSTREELLEKLELIEQHARSDREAGEVSRVRSIYLMFDATDAARPTTEDLQAVEDWIEGYRASVEAQLAQLGNVLSEIGT